MSLFPLCYGLVSIPFLQVAGVLESLLYVYDQNSFAVFSLSLPPFSSKYYGLVGLAAPLLELLELLFSASIP